MSTNREMVSRVRSTHRLLSGDTAINDRTVLAELKSNARVLIKRELNLRKLVATDSIYTTIPCLEMKEVPLSECCEYVDPCTIARSKNKLPKIGESNYLYAIKGVFSIDQKIKLKEVTPSRYINLLKLPARVAEYYYWIQNDYLYVTNPNLCKLKFIAFFEDEVPNDVLYPKDCECEAYAKEEECLNPLDKAFKCPGYLEQAVVEMTSAMLLKTYFRIPEDRNSDNADGQASNQQDR
jgi:hypothetical protein